MAPTKVCACCGARFARPTGTNRISDERWQARRYCTVTCPAVASPGAELPGVLSAYDHYRAGATMSSQNLLDRIQSLYRKTAAKRGLSSEWEAAVMLGMRA